MFLSKRSLKEDVSESTKLLGIKADVTEIEYRIVAVAFDARLHNEEKKFNPFYTILV